MSRFQLKVREYKMLDLSVKESRKAKAQLWQEYLDKADGDLEEATKMMLEEAQEEYESS